ncbi:L-fucose mutarotase [Klebsiella pneumoniae]|nr:L-fucose mutarotase [Klebsiella pneumoniae]SLR75057.1 L-fucose mutarotase [Klebsiella pneumoniae]SLT24696.1 L-fucose mutarotase [Klebsiella pneumoniae]SLT29618.1 L-fucose mutarotase [Klebsiella pneumoniae]SLT41914.1 L-fucose mutarotase [Klebsiella pneumoniae]
MLKTISPLISPELLKVLAEMGHGDEIIFSDAHFPAHSMGPQVIRADGLRVSDLLQAIIPLFELDSYAPPVVMMAAVEGDALDPTVEQRYRQALSAQAPARISCGLTALPSTTGRKKPLRSLSQESALSTEISF